ncbi:MULTISPECIES: response regulator [Streptomyces]|uniref:Transcriptional regulatory protein n=2 Tax=Streptomyces TaxID=1883 RepID=A0ABQ3SAB0_9ACTN|nr:MULTISPECIES: response regulator [Streptomyces]MBK3627426.1 response regulator [Streptomyces sp. MBT49]MBK3635507.1 response regulator [Streptomyces sp. MBT97]GGQ95304.1 transcriptional regulatory protein [Streptomyces asoensis]GHI64905.1 transcriptional regulatory protein [Streptomyces asoensis]
MIDVLVVDDDFRVAEINAKYVGKVPGFRVAARAHSAAQALACVQRGRIDLVLLDHYLPDGTGLELVHRMRDQGHGTDVIMITAAGDVTTVRTAMRLGALHYLVKPFTFAALRARLDSYAALRRTVDRVGGHGIAGQEQVDRIFGALRTGPAPSAPGLPSGHSEPTTDLICAVLHRANHPLSAHEVAAETGLSRSTAQRYLRHLEQAGRLHLSLKYGDTGRPEHRYAWVAP